tara:strand:- start:794 stop:1732 length:939 start_codon:yes stop_codon:yes gene_type:complete
MFIVNFKKKNFLNFFLKLIVAITIFYFVLKKIDINQVLEIFSLSLEIILVCTIISLILFFFSSWRLSQLYLGKIDFKIFFWLKLHGYASMLNLFIPGKMGDLLKYFLIKKKDKKYPKSYLIGMFVVERSIDLLIIICAFFLFLGIVNNNIFDFIIILLIFFFFIYFLRQKIPNRIKGKKINCFKNLQVKLFRFIHHFNLYKKKLFFNKKIIFILIITIVFWLLSFYQINILINFFNEKLNFFDNSLILVQIILISLIPISISGLGVREFLFIFLFGPLIGNNEAFVISIYFYLLRYLFPGILGLIISVMSKN